MEQYRPKNNTEDSWFDYYEALEHASHSKYLEKAIQYCDKKENALDVGAGNLRDTKYLLAEGFEVTALDPSDISVQMTKDLGNPKVKQVQEFFGKWDSTEQFDLVNGCNMFFNFTEPLFSVLIEKAKNHVIPGGVFCANFKGINDSWNNSGTPDSVRTFQTEEEVRGMFDGFEIVGFKVKEYDGTSALGQQHHFHDFVVIAKKNED